MKKNVCFALCAVLLCCMLTACSDSENTGVEENNESENNELLITVDYHYANTDESAIRAYEKLCQAVINHEEAVSFNTSLTDNVTTLFYTSFPLYALVEGMEFLENGSGVGITYKNDVEEHTKKVDEFKSAVSSIMSECGFGEVSSSKYLLNLYTYIASNVTVDTSVNTVMDTIINKKGISASITGMFEYLLLQAGISASHIMNLDSTSMGMMLSLAEFNGAMYYFDPASEIEATGGKGLTYFAMDSERTADSLGENLTFTDNSDATVIEDNTFAALAECSSYTVEENKVTADCRTNGNFEFDLL